MKDKENIKVLKDEQLEKVIGGKQDINDPQPKEATIGFNITALSSMDHLIEQDK